jgi:hypothetical protein
MPLEPAVSDLADPLRQPLRFVQQADAMLRHGLAQPGGPDPVGVIDRHLELSFANALHDAQRVHSQPQPTAPAVTLAVHPLAGLPIEGLAGLGDASVAPYHGVLTTGVGGPLMTYGAYPSPPVSGIPSVEPEDTLAAGLQPGGVGAGASRPMGPELENLIGEMSGKYQVPDWIVRNVIRQESGGNPGATSPVGAQGLMQLMPGTAAELGVANAYDPRQNVEGGVKYLRQLLDMFHNDPTKAVAAYNAGPGAVQKYGGVPPFAETQNYVKRIIG